MRTIKDISALHNVPVLVRAALNVPIEGGEIASDYRLRRALPTLSHLSERGARVIVISHIGEKGTETLEPVARALGKLMGHVAFSPATIGPGAEKAAKRLLPGETLVLENLRRNKGEIRNDEGFARELASLADVFVQDSFDTCHRRHASIVGVPKFLPSYAGLVVEEEVRVLKKALRPASPSLAIIGGLKFSTKEPVLATLLKTYDKLFVGGALASDFLKAAGHPVGRSVVSGTVSDDINLMLKSPRLVLPLDSIVAAAPDAPSRRVTSLDTVKEDEMILDEGPGTSAVLSDLVKRAKAILWNGPLGSYEHDFTDATDALARAIAESGAYSIVGGGDTVGAIERAGLLGRFSFVSTGGGAMLEFLAHGTLPGIEALDNSP